MIPGLRKKISMYIHQYRNCNNIYSTKLTATCSICLAVHYESSTHHIRVIELQERSTHKLNQTGSSYNLSH